MPRIVVIVGLPGSGKTRCAQSEEFSGPFSGSIVIDDMGFSERWIQLPAEQQAWSNDAWAKTLALTKKAIELGVDVVLSDVDFCNKERRDWLLQSLHPQAIDWVYFQNDPQNCRLNVLQRHRRRRTKEELAKIESLTATYVPDGDDVREVKHDLSIPALIQGLRAVADDEASAELNPAVLSKIYDRYVPSLSQPMRDVRETLLAELRKLL